jgi:hypothetical protein
MHAVLHHVIDAHGQEGADADMQRHGHPLDAAGVKRREQFGGEVQPGGGRGDRTFAIREDRLVIRRILGRRALGPLDVRRQGERAGLLQGGGEGRALAVEAERDAAIGPTVLDGRRQIRAVEGQHIAGMQPLRVPRERLPGAVGERPVEGDADARLAPLPSLSTPRQELRRNHPGVVGDEDIAGRQQIGQIADDAVVQPVPRHMQKPGGVPRPGGILRDEFGGQVEVEIGETHGGVQSSR